jgi:hypothetical protein
VLNSLADDEAVCFAPSRLQANTTIGQWTPFIQNIQNKLLAGWVEEGTNPAPYFWVAPTCQHSALNLRKRDRAFVAVSGW